MKKTKKGPERVAVMKELKKAVKFSKFTLTTFREKCFGPHIETFWLLWPVSALCARSISECDLVKADNFLEIEILPDATGWVNIAPNAIISGVVT